MSHSITTKYLVQNNIGLERFTSDTRQIGAMMMIFSICVLVYPQVRNARLTGSAEVTYGVTGIVSDRQMGFNEDLLNTFLILGGVVQVVFGGLGLLVGYITVVHDFGNLWLTRFLIFVGQLSWFPLLTALAESILQTSQGINNGYIPLSFDPTLSDVRFFGAMGFLGIVGWYVGLLGSLCLMVFALHAFQSGSPDSRNRSFYQSRLVFYSIFMLLASASQLLLGLYSKKQFGSGPLSKPVLVAMYVIVYPEIAIFCGGLQALTALLGFARAAGVSATPNNPLFQVLVWFSWFVTILGTDMAQVYSLPNGVGAGRAPSLTVLTFGLHVLLAFLDYKMRILPFEFPSDYYRPPLIVDQDETSFRCTPSASFMSTKSADNCKGSEVQKIYDEESV